MKIMNYRPDPDNDQLVIGGNGQRYPSRYHPGQDRGWAVDTAWEILGYIKPDIIPIDARSFLAGLIAGRLMKSASEGAPENKS